MLILILIQLQRSNFLAYSVSQYEKISRLYHIEHAAIWHFQVPYNFLNSSMCQAWVAVNLDVIKFILNMSIILSVRCIDAETVYTKRDANSVPGL